MAYRQNNSQRRSDEVRFDLMEHIGVLSRKDNGWTREVNIVSWNSGPAKVDIREWDPDHERMTRGVTLFEDEAEKLAKVLAKRYGISIQGNFRDRSFSDERLESTAEAADDVAVQESNAEQDSSAASASGTSAGEAA